MCTFANSEDPDSIMLHFIIMVYTVCKCKKRSSDKIYIFFYYYYLTPLDMYNGTIPSLLYQTSREEAISIQRVKHGYCCLEPSFHPFENSF